MRRFLIFGCAVLIAAAMPIGFAASQSASAWRNQPIERVKAAAKSGDKFAQLEMGERYENGGLGVLQDYRLAIKWYKRASKDESDSLLAYSAPVGHERYGKMVPTYSISHPGLPIADSRLTALKARLGLNR